MSGSSKRAEDAAGNIDALGQSYALRGWLTSLLIQTLQGEAMIKSRITELEHEAQRLRQQLDQTTPAIASLGRTIHSIDEAIRRRRDAVSATAVAKPRRPDEAVAEPRTAAREPRAGARVGRRKDAERGSSGRE